MNRKTIWVWLVLPTAIGMAAIVGWSAALSPRPFAPPGDAAVGDHWMAEVRLDLARRADFGLIVDLEYGRAKLVNGALVLREIAIDGSGFSAHARSAGGVGAVDTISARHGTLPFQPVQRVIAPPDTASAEPPSMRPLDSHPAYGVLQTAQGLEIRMIPSGLAGRDRLRVAAYRLTRHLGRSVRLLASAVSGQDVVDREVWIRIPDDDARALYRALPDGAIVAVRFPT